MSRWRSIRGRAMLPIYALRQASMMSEAPPLPLPPRPVIAEGRLVLGSVYLSHKFVSFELLWGRLVLASLRCMR